jgi:hypothetical protein
MNTMREVVESPLFAWCVNNFFSGFIIQPKSRKPVDDVLPVSYVMAFYLSLERVTFHSQSHTQSLSVSPKTDKTAHFNVDTTFAVDTH